MKIIWNNNVASWSPGYTLEIVKLQAGWDARLREFGVIVKHSFPYDDPSTAKQHAEQLALERWG